MRFLLRKLKSIDSDIKVEIQNLATIYNQIPEDSKQSLYASKLLRQIEILENLERELKSSINFLL